MLAEEITFEVLAERYGEQIAKFLMTEIAKADRLTYPANQNRAEPRPDGPQDAA